MNLELYLEQMKELVNIDSGSGNVARNQPGWQINWLAGIRRSAGT